MKGNNQNEIETDHPETLQNVPLASSGAQEWLKSSESPILISQRLL